MYINPIHLLAIIPLCGVFFFLGGLISTTRWEASHGRLEAENDRLVTKLQVYQHVTETFGIGHQAMESTANRYRVITEEI